MAKLQMSLERYEDIHAVAIRCRGDIDAHSFEELDETVYDLLEDGLKYIIVDLARVPYMSSAGIGVLIGSKNEAEDEHEGGFVLLRPVPTVTEVFKMMGFDQLFTILATEEAAWEHFGITPP